MSNGLKGLMLSAGVIITCIVIGIAFFITREAKDIAAEGIGQMGEYTAEMANGGIEFYNGLTVSGNEVIRSAKKLSRKTDVYIITNGERDGAAEGVKVESMKWLTDHVYRHGNFLGKVSYNDDGSVSRITFIQQKK